MSGLVQNTFNLREADRRARRAAVLIDEAYYEFSGVTMLGSLDAHPNLFVCRTFSKAFGMAGMRLGCLFSHPVNIQYLHKAQSPYSVNMLAAMAAEAAVEDTAYVGNYVTEALASRELRACAMPSFSSPARSNSRDASASVT